MNYEIETALDALEATIRELEYEDYATEQMTELEQEFVFAVVEAATDPAYMSLLINYMATQIRNETALEGATKESIKTLFGEDMKEAKEDLRDAKSLISAKKYSEAERKVKQARAGFVKCHETLAKVKQGPISMITAGMISTVLSVITVFKSFKDVSPSAKVALVSKTLVNIAADIVSLLPGVSVAMNTTKNIVANSITNTSMLTNISTALSNKFNKIKQNPNSEETLSDKAGAFNNAQMQLLALLKFYITTCDGILKDVQKMKSEK